MALVAGVNIPDNKRVEIALRSVYGVGPAVAKRVVEDSALPGNPRVRELSEDELNRLRSALDRSGAIIEGDLRREVQMNVRRLIDIGSYRGLRHRRGPHVDSARRRMPGPSAAAGVRSPTRRRSPPRPPVVRRSPDEALWPERKKYPDHLRSCGWHRSLIHPPGGGAKIKNAEKSSHTTS